jgi:beta-glucanase (GH16 family)
VKYKGEKMHIKRDIFLVLSFVLFACTDKSTNDQDSSNDAGSDSDSDSSSDADTPTDTGTDSTSGILSIIGLRENDHGADYTSGRLNSNYEVPNDVGTWVQARLKMATKRCNAEDPYINGTWPAFWLLGSDSSEQGYGGSVAWPECGEIDIVEWIGSYDDTHYQTNQWGSPAFPVDHNSSTVVNYTTGPENWHVYGVRFNADSITFTFDGTDIATKSYDDSDDHSHRIILNLALGGDMAGEIAEDFEQGMLQVDWVRVTDAAGNLLWSDEMESESSVKENWFPHIGFAYNNEEQYYTDFEADNFKWHEDAALGQCH